MSDFDDDCDLDDDEEGGAGDIGAFDNKSGTKVLLVDDEEFTRQNPGPLVDQLVKRVLTIRAGFTPDNRARMHGQIGAVHAHALAVALHFQLLKIGR